MFSKKVLSLSMVLLLSCAHQALHARERLTYPNITDFSLLYKQEHIIAMMTPERTVIFDCKNQEMLITIPTDNDKKMTAVAGLNFEIFTGCALAIGYDNGDVKLFYVNVKDKKYWLELTHHIKRWSVNGIAAGNDFNEQGSRYWSVITASNFNFYKWMGFVGGWMGGSSKEKVITTHNNRGVRNTCIGSDEGRTRIFEAPTERGIPTSYSFRTEHKGIAYYPKKSDIVATGEFALSKDQKPLIKFINLAPSDEEKKSKVVKLTEEEAHMALEKGLFIHDDGEGNYSMLKKSDNEEEEEKARLVYQFQALSANVGVTEVAFDRKASMLAVGGRNGTVEFWEVDPIKEKSKLLRTYQHHKVAIKKIVFHPENNLWFSLDDDKILNIYGLNEIVDEEDLKD